MVTSGQNLGMVHVAFLSVAIILDFVFDFNLTRLDEAPINFRKAFHTIFLLL